MSRVAPARNRMWAHSTMLIDYDDIQAWGPDLSRALSGSVSASARQSIATRHCAHIEDAGHFRFVADSRIDTQSRGVDDDPNSLCAITTES